MKKIPVIILGATGLVGQKLVSLLSNHPWFEIKGLAASKKSKGKKYQDVVGADFDISAEVKGMVIQSCYEDFDAPLLFSALSSDAAQEIESFHLKNGRHIVSNARCFRNDSNVPILIPEINPSHLQIIYNQQTNGKIITNPNCAVAGLALALAPLHRAFRIESVHVSTLQAISGAGLKDFSKETLHNVLPHIEGEEEKIQQEPLKILGLLKNNQFEHAKINISAQANRVSVINGHLMNVSIKLSKKTSQEDILNEWKNFQSPAENLPSGCSNPFIYFEEKERPQPKLDVELKKGMALSIGKLRPCPCLDYKFNILVDNLMRGAAGASILNAELFVQKFPELFSPQKQKLSSATY